MEGKTEGKKIADNFLALLIKAGLRKKAKEILDLAEDIVLKKQGHRKIILETARKLNAKDKEKLAGLAKPGDAVKEKINPELIAGVKVVVNGEKQLDMTMKNKLQKIF